ncbi:MAG: T9SS type A sorting domain-containing protein [bacterium]
MHPKILSCTLLVASICFCDIANGQTSKTAGLATYYEYLAPKLTSGTIALDGTNIEAIWGCASSVPLIYYASNGSTNWMNPWPGANDSCEIWVVWQAVWSDSQIYFFTTIKDDDRDHDHFDLHDLNNIDDDDGVHLWFESMRNATTPVWDWAGAASPDQNCLIHNKDMTCYHVQQDLAANFMNLSKMPGTVNFAHLLAGPTPNPICPDSTLFIESSVTSSSGTPYMDNESVRFNMTANDADELAVEPDVRERRLTWNNIGTGIEPWNCLGRITLCPAPPLTCRFKRNNTYVSSAFVALDGKLGEEGYRVAPIINASARTTSGTAADTAWFYWTEYDDAGVMWRAFRNLNPANNKLYLGFEIVDDFRDSNNLMNNVIEDDGVLLWIDLNRNRVREASNDINVLIHNTGARFQYTGNEENYDSPYTGEEVQVVIGPYGPRSNNWTAEIQVDISRNKPPFDSLLIDIGYNDADNTTKREHQLAWSTFTDGVQPWREFGDLGLFILKDTGPPSSVSSPEEHRRPLNYQLLPNYPNPFTSETIIAFSLPAKTHVTIKVYDLSGRLVATLVDRIATAGAYQVQWNGTHANRRPVSNGIYFVIMNVEGFILTQKILLMR